MPAVPLHLTTPQAATAESPSNPLPNLIQTPSGFALLEIQGTIHAPFSEVENAKDQSEVADHEIVQTSIGRIEFPLHDSKSEPGHDKWTKRVYLYVGKHQRLTGEVKKLPKPLMVIRKRKQDENDNNERMSTDMDGESSMDEELEVLEVIKYKILFAGRPEPVSE